MQNAINEYHNALKKNQFDIERQLEKALEITIDGNHLLKSEIELIQEELQNNQENINNELRTLQEEIKKKQIDDENNSFGDVIHNYQNSLEKNQLNFEKQLQETVSITSNENNRLRSEIKLIQIKLIECLYSSKMF